MSSSRCHGIVLSGIGGQGVLSLAQILVEALQRSGFQAAQSELRGARQRGSSVSAQVCYSEAPLDPPAFGDGCVDLLIALEPLEALRFVSMLKMNGHLVVSEEPRLDQEAYPPLEDVYAALKAVRGAHLVDTEDLVRRLDHRQAGGLTLLGLASRFLPAAGPAWQEAITRQFEGKGAAILAKNLEAFEAGRRLLPATPGA